MTHIRSLTDAGSTMMARLCWATSLCCALATAHAYQIAPLGSSYEAQLTNEPEARLVWVADRLGRLVKGFVHEEITQLGLGCPVSNSELTENMSCYGKDRPFATPFVIYGVRWNDLPPFRLEESQGKGCKKLSGQAACMPSQTVRFSTQPECWVCLFKQANETARTKKISQCQKGAGYVTGNLMTRSHFGDLQFLHSMANHDGVAAEVTRDKIMGWLEFAWRVARKEYGPDRTLDTIDIPVIKEHLGCTGWTIERLYILGRADKLRPRLHQIAFGSLLHTVQDSFAAGHTQRELPSLTDQCEATGLPRPGRIQTFHSYASQDSAEHDHEDRRDAMTEAAKDRWPDAVEATRQFSAFYESGATWEVVRPYAECVFSLADKPTASGAGPFAR